MNLMIILPMLLAFKGSSVSAATSCWNANTGAAAATTPDTSTHCINTLTYGPSGAFTSTNWPSWVLTNGPTSCTASSTVLCTSSSPTSATSATIANSPTVTSCYTGSALTAATLTSQAQTACPSPSYFCKATYVASPATVTLECSASPCAASATVLCSIASNTNQALGCYVGASYSIGVSTFTKTICQPPSSGVSAAYCKNEYTWSSTYGYIITGSCATTCAAVAISGSGTAAMVGTTCSGSVYGNSFGVKSATSNSFLMIMALIGMILF